MKSTRPLRTGVVVCLLALAAFAQNPSIPKPPRAPKRPVTDKYQDVKVTDNYRWLENWDDPKVKKWSAAENTRTRKFLDHLPSRPAIKARIQQLVASTSASYYDLQFRGGTLFAMKFKPPQQQPMLIAMHSADDPASAKVIFDPNAGGKGSLSIEFYTPSLDGKYVAVAITEGGSEDCSARIFEVATGKELSEIVPRVNFATAGGSIAWKSDNSGFYYTRYPQGNERPPEDANFYQQVYFHKLGADPKHDTYILGKEFPRIAEIHLHTSDDGRWLLVSVGNGDGGEFAHYLMDSSSHWTQVTHFEDGIVSVKAGPDDALYLLSRKDAPRGQILRLPLAHLDLAEAKVIVPQSFGAPFRSPASTLQRPASGFDESAGASIESFVLAYDRLYVTDILGGPSRVRVFSLNGQPVQIGRVYGKEVGGSGEPNHELDLPPISAVDQIVPLTYGDVLYHTSTYLDPPAWYRFDAASGKSARTALFETSPVQFDDAEVVRDFAVSKDGTRVPLNIIRRKGTKLDGSNPALLGGYGGYGISEKPYFAGLQGRMWLDQGGVYVLANIRGGAEYGEDWHLQGNLTHKQNVFDDFIACAQYLVEHKYTSPARLAIIGGSNGGLLMGAAFTQRPDLFRAVVSYVGIYDMLRVELDPNGAFNVTEFGTVKDPGQFKALYAYSPYHHVEDGAGYPAILFLTGENDHRVNPMQSRKMTARLQAANGSDHPILLRTTASAGHGIGTALDEEIEQGADVFSFLFDQMGIKYTAAGK